MVFGKKRGELDRVAFFGFFFSFFIAFLFLFFSFLFLTYRTTEQGWGDREAAARRVCARGVR
jgi:hypothetical protein